MGTLELINISASYMNKKVIDDFSFKVSKAKNICILGGMATGKTTLANIIAGNVKYEGQIKINGVEIVKSNAYLIKRYISFVENKKQDSTRKVVDILFDALDGKELSSEKEEKTVNLIVKNFNLNKYLNQRLNTLDYNNRFYVLIIAALLKKTDYLVLDDVLCHLTKNQISTIFAYAKKNKISIINFTTNINEVLYSQYLIVLYDKKVAMEGKTMEALKEETLLKRLGFSLPFMVDLSTQLNYYEIIDELYLDQDEMVNNIWN